jgi:hypothetical protein
MGRTGVKADARVEKKTKPVGNADWMLGLNLEINKKLKKQCGTVAQTLVEQACQGKESSIRLLIALRDKVERVEPSNGETHGLSQAAEWEKESPWRGEMCEASVEMRSGGVEPEG